MEQENFNKKFEKNVEMSRKLEVLVKLAHSFVDKNEDEKRKIVMEKIEALTEELKNL